MWTTIQENIVKRLGEKSAHLANEYFQAEKRQRKYHFILSGASITSIFFSGMISFFFPEQLILGGILSFTSAFITASNNFLALSQKAENSRGTRLRLNSLYSSIQNELSMYNNERYNANLFINQKQNAFFHIIQSADSLIFSDDADRLSVESLKVARDINRPTVIDMFSEENSEENN